MVKTKVICAFTGLGKSTVGKKYNNICDLRVSKFMYDYSNIKEKDYEKMKGEKTRLPNKDWPNNYLSAIRAAINNYDIVLVPANEEIKELLPKNNINFLLILPSYDSRDKLINIMHKRGNNDNLIDVVIKRFDNWSRNQDDYNYPIVVLEKDKYLEDYLLQEGYINK